MWREDERFAMNDEPRHGDQQLKQALNACAEGKVMHRTFLLRAQS